jgi:hypothetical protein
MPEPTSEIDANHTLLHSPRHALLGSHTLQPAGLASESRLGSPALSEAAGAAAAATAAAVTAATSAAAAAAAKRSLQAAATAGWVWCVVLRCGPGGSPAATAACPVQCLGRPRLKLVACSSATPKVPASAAPDGRLAQQYLDQGDYAERGRRR